MSPPIERVILIPGLLEPRFAFWPLRFRLRKQGVPVEIYPDRLAFRRFDDSIDRLIDSIESGREDQSIAIITHSFGDWIARQAIAKARRSRVTKLVSVAPVMRAGFMPGVVQLLTGNLVPEIKIIMDRELASKNLDCDQQVKRLVMWARFDECLRPVDLRSIRRLETRHIAATHLSIILQPNVIRQIDDFLFADRETP